ncbi:hypothetical protein [Symbiopectobacterium purcellii]|uniref:hypothetical protein n=1 Tax=Symbiopectobacterium purcellii TaxID=2871826 RepID=UPI003F84C33B
MENLGFNRIGKNHSIIKKIPVNKLARKNKLSVLANKIKKISNTIIVFIKKNPRNIATGIGFASMLVGVTTANPALISVGIASLVGAVLHDKTPPSVTSLPSHNAVTQYEPKLARKSHSIYNILCANSPNKHGNAFKGLSASMKRNSEAVRDVSKRNSIDIGFDDHVFEKKLFPVISEAEIHVAPVNLIYGKLVKPQSVQIKLTNQSSIEKCVSPAPPSHPEMTKIGQESPEVLTHAQHKKLQKITVKPDGYCFFRCVLIKDTDDIFWAKNASSKQVKDKLFNQYKDKIEDSINGSKEWIFNSFDNKDLKTYFRQIDFPNCIINDSFKSDGCCLWSPIGLCAAINPYLNYDSLSKNDKEQLEQFIDGVYYMLAENLQISVDAKNINPHAEVENGHYTWYQ